MAESLGITQSAYSHMEIGTKSNLTIDHMNTLVNSFSINPYYLLNGQPPMYIEARAKRQDVKVAGGCYLVPVAAQAGYLGGLESQDQERLPKVIIPGFDGDGAMFFEVAGNSMHPIVQDGDFVGCIKVNRPQEIRDGLVYVIVSDQYGLAVKYIKPKKGVLRCLSHNANEFKPYDLQLSDVRELWEVQMRVTRSIVNHGFKTEKVGYGGSADRLEQLLKKMVDKDAF